ncbi:MAG: DoxX family protein [Deltaproteobacteria bacterium]|nr:MAG: DoxX family protein [Deltaproteobacteria bacterium]
MNAALWVVQALLAALFLFAGGMKLVMPLEALKGPVPLPGLFLRFIGVCEVLGGLGLILPQLTQIRPTLTPIAAAGLATIMVGAVVITVAGEGVGMALIPLVTGRVTRRRTARSLQGRAERPCTPGPRRRCRFRAPSSVVRAKGGSRGSRREGGRRCDS